MRRAICFIEPRYAEAGAVSTWKFVYTAASPLSKGALLKFDILSCGSPQEWEIPQTDFKIKKKLIWAELPNKKTLTAQFLEDPQSLSAQFEFVLPIDLKAGENFIIYMGTPLASKDKNGNRAQLFTARKRTFLLHIDPKGKGDYKEFDHFHFDVKGSSLKNLRVLAPSVVAKNRRFDIIVRFEDEFGNLTCKAPENTLIELSYQNLRENLNWKLFVPETGFITLPNLYFNEEAVYKIQLKNLNTQEIYFSSPIKCFAESDLSLFWGLFHGESEKMDSKNALENCLKYFRDEKGYHFYTASYFDKEEETKSEIWKMASAQIAEFNEDERFVSFPGQIWVGQPIEEGTRQFVFSKDNRSFMRKKDLKTNALKKIYKTTSAKDLISIPMFTMNEKTGFDFKEFNIDFERVVEIYNAWGSSETSNKENLKPISGKLTKEFNEGSIQKALDKNCRFGFVAGGLDDRDIFNGFYESNQTQYSPGLTAIYATTQTRDNLFEALYNRRCYATTGAKIVLGFNIASGPMGSELSTQTKPGLFYNRFITGFVAGEKPIKDITIFRNGKTFAHFTPKESYFEFSLDDSELLDKIVFYPKDKKPPFVYYYLRAVQEDGEIAWGSPIWIDLEEKLINPKKKKSSKPNGLLDLNK